MREMHQVAAAIQRAQAELEQALMDLEKVPSIDPGTVAFKAHTLNNYLAVTMGAVQLLLLSLADYPDPQVRTWLQGLGHVTDLMRHTVSQLSHESTQAETSFRYLKWDLAVLARRTCDYYGRLAKGKNIRLVCEPPADISPVWTDPVAVAAVLDNLLSNAVKYSPPGKSIWVELRDEQTSVVCSVRDEGPGLSPEDQAGLFQRGVRLSARTTGGEASNGYGLAVAKELVDQLGGEIWCESTLGAGACFAFRLPAYRGQDEQEKP
jgi:signal transduction histidine kinase